MAFPDEQRMVRNLLRFLAVAHFALAILAAAALLYIWMIYDDAVLRAANPNRAAELDAWSSHRLAYVALVAVASLALVGGIVSGVCIWRRKWRGFSQAVGVLSLLLFPIGTAIGITTLVTLAQKPFREQYAAGSTPASPRP
jgi:hypothetical protein